MYNSEEPDTNGYKTPASFRRTESSRRAAERAKDLPPLDLHLTDGPVRNEETQTEYPDKGTDMSNDRDMRPDPYASPRYPYAHNAYESPRQQPAYRGGRPDMGFASGDKYVPYPQEPLSRRHDYVPPPEIGQRFDPYKEQEIVKPHPGWILLLRYAKDGDAMVRRALHMAQKHIDSDGGRILGIAPPYGIRIHEGGDGWVTYGRLRHMGRGQWDVQQGPNMDETNYCVLAIYYPSLSRAIQWFDRDSAFKQKDFPPPNCTDCIVLPLNSTVDTKYCKTMVLTEYPKISHPEYFRDKFSVPTEDMMRSRFRASPYVVKASSIPIDDPHQRVARHLRGSWIKRNSVITLSMFDSLQETRRYFSDPEYYKCKEAQDRVSAPTTVVMDMEDWRL